MTVLLLLATAFAAAGTPAAAHATETPISQAPNLTWGFKLSWRSYAGEPQLSGGATRVATTDTARYNVTWPLVSGSYDDQTRTTVVRYRGSARWTSHPAATSGMTPPPGYDGPRDIDLLDVTITDPQITISGDAATITAEATSRDINTWKIVDYGRITVADLAADEVTPTVAGGTTTWPAMRATMNAQASATFGDSYYPKGIAIDPIGFAYSGPGGAPEYADHFDASGTIKLGPDGDNVLVAPSSTPNDNYETLAVDQEHQIAHTRVRSDVNGVDSWTYQAFDLATMTKLGAPLTVPYGNGGGVLLNDTTNGRLYLDTGAQDARAQYYLHYDRDKGEYVEGHTAQPIPTLRDHGRLAWDPVGQRAFEVGRVDADGNQVPSGQSGGNWRLFTYTEQPGGTWRKVGYDLDNGPAETNASRYQALGVAATDGSLIILGDRQTTSEAKIPGAYRVVTYDDDGDDNVSAIPGTEVAPTNPFTYAVSGADNAVALVNTSESGTIQRLTFDTDSSSFVGEQSVALGFPPAELRGDSVSLDPDDGTAWVGGLASQRIVGVRDGRIVADQTFPIRQPRHGTLVALPGGRLVTQSGDGSPNNPYAQAVGFQQIKRLGVTPTITTSPEDRTLTLQANDASQQTTLSAATGSSPAATRQWQVRPAGAVRFHDVAGATGQDLAITARRENNGDEYRAVFTNPIGRVATRAAKITVRYAPRITFAPLDADVRPGHDATFEVIGDGSPTPTVTWQRRVDGFWQPIASDDDNYATGDGKLTVPDANADQSGSLFRARLRNDVATTYTPPATLTVRNGSIPPEGLSRDDVGFEWTGDDELQGAPPFGGSNYFSAGVSDGTEATYSAAAGNVRVVQVAPSGAESTPSYATRAAHVANGRQRIRMTAGSGRIEADGSTTITWSGSFTVNFYGGLVPFTFTDPQLVVDAHGDGRLTATMSGYGATRDDPNARQPIAPVSGVTVATFSGVQIDPDGRVTIQPRFAGVAVNVPAGTTPQDRSSSGWGAWPQAFVDFQQKTGLASYWYTSGGTADARKQPTPFTVDFSGATAPTPPPTQQQTPPKPDAQQPGTDAGTAAGAPPVAPSTPANKPSPAKVGKHATISVRKVAQRLDGRRRATLMTLACPSGGACTVTAPRRVRVTIGGHRYEVRILAPSKLTGGHSGAVRVELTRAAANRLAGRRARVRITVALRNDAGRTTRTATATITRRRGG